MYNYALRHAKAQLFVSICGVSVNLINPAIKLGIHETELFRAKIEMVLCK